MAVPFVADDDLYEIQERAGTALSAGEDAPDVVPTDRAAWVGTTLLCLLVVAVAVGVAVVVVLLVIALFQVLMSLVAGILIAGILLAVAAEVGS